MSELSQQSDEERRAEVVTDALWDTFGFHGKPWDAVYAVVLVALQTDATAPTGKQT